jgi:hypothetical protein
MLSEGLENLWAVEEGKKKTVVAHTCHKPSRKRQDKITLPSDLLLEHTHQFVALSTFAGHPLGGALDLTIAY